MNRTTVVTVLLLAGCSTSSSGRYGYHEGDLEKPDLAHDVYSDAESGDVVVDPEIGSAGATMVQPDIVENTGGGENAEVPVPTGGEAPLEPVPVEPTPVEPSGGQPSSSTGGSDSIPSTPAGGTAPVEPTPNTGGQEPTGGGGQAATGGETSEPVEPDPPCTDGYLVVENVWPYTRCPELEAENPGWQCFNTGYGENRVFCHAPKPGCVLEDTKLCTADTFM